MHNYEDVPGAIPIPATLSLELGRVINEQQNISYRFVSDYPFKGRAPHTVDPFEKNALALLREDSNQKATAVSASLSNDNVRIVAPIIMGAACVSCHNMHADSPKRPWKVGDVRAIQGITIGQPLAANIFSFKYLLGISSSWRHPARLHRPAGQAGGDHPRHEQGAGNRQRFLAGLSMKISRYLSPTSRTSPR